MENKDAHTINTRPAGEPEAGPEAGDNSRRNFALVYLRQCLSLELIVI
ncbi:MAG: hypothetical protein ACHQIM_01290 [Sphingobacteriales bacterium]